MHTHASRLALALFCSPAMVGLASQTDPGAPADPSQNPAPTGPAVPSDVKQPPPPRKTTDFTVYGRLNLSFDVGTQGMNGIACTNANSCGALGTTPQGNLKWLPDVSSNLSRFGIR